MIAKNVRTLCICSVIACSSGGAIREPKFVRTAYPAFTYLPEAASKLGQTSEYSLLPKVSLSYGVYGTPYQFPSKYVVIELEPSMLVGKLPEQLATALAATVGKSYAQFIADQSNRVYAFVIMGNPVTGHGSIYNAIFHFFYEIVSGVKQFNASVPMGLFNPVGLSAAAQQSIPVNTFGSINVNTHPGDPTYAVSPNNARFNINPSRTGGSSGWFAAIAPNKKTISINFLAILPDGFMQEIQTSFINNPGMLVQAIAGAEMPEEFPQAQRIIFRGILQSVENLLPHEAAPAVPELKAMLIQLLKQLELLHAMLLNMIVP